MDVYIAEGGREWIFPEPSWNEFAGFGGQSGKYYLPKFISFHFLELCRRWRVLLADEVHPPVQNMTYICEYKFIGYAPVYLKL